MQQYCVYLTKQ